MTVALVKRVTFFLPGQLFLIFMPSCSSMDALKHKYKNKKLLVRVSNSYAQSHQDNFILEKSESWGERRGSWYLYNYHSPHDSPASHMVLS